MTEPLPYVVKLRTSAGDDLPPVVTEVRCYAYSPLDAVTQAMVQTYGTTDGIGFDRCRVENVSPDLPEWRRMRDEEKQREARK